MINAYRINPLEYLTVTAARRNLAGDVTSIIRIHHFLEKWGLINYQIDPRTKSSVVGPQFTGHFQITLDTPSGLVPFLPEAKKSADKSTIEDSITATESISTSVNSEESPLEELPLNLEARRNIYIKSSDLSKKIPNNSVHFFCNVCGKECTKTRYHNLKVKAYNNNPNSTNNNASIVCVNCFEQGLFPQNFYSSDFIKLKEEVESTNSWSEQETLLLLEGIEIYGTYDATIQPGNSNSNSNGQWDKISEHVGTKSREECLIKFIQLPIEDRYLTKLSKKEEKPVKNEGNGLIVSEIIKEIVSKNDSETNKEISTIASKKVETSNDEQLSLVNQVIELTLEKVSLKLSSIDALEENLIAKEKKLEQERKQVYYERWAQFEKINKYKAEHPELSELLDNLATPIKLQEVVKAKGSEESKKEEGGNDGDYMDIDLASNGLGEPNSIPVSVSNPKSYQFWSG